MVLKRPKGSICTGATFRKPLTFSKQPPLLNCHNGNHRANANLIDCDSSGIVLEGSTDGQVQYSLNKKGRWNIPSMLKEAIEGEVFCGEDYKISVVEKHDFNLGRNDRGSCISLYQCNGPKSKITKKVPKGNGYMNSNAILKQLDLPENHRNRRRRRQHIELMDEVQEDIPEVQFEVVYPKPADRMLTEKDYRWKVSRKNACRKEFSQDRLFYDMNADVDQNDYSDTDDSESDTYSTRMDAITFSFADAIKNKNKGTKKSKRKHSRCSAFDKIENKDSKVIKIDGPAHVEKSDSDTDRPTTMAYTRPTFKPEPVTIEIDQETTSGLYLEDLYGCNYKELSVMPRVFVIDISNTVKATIKNSNGCLVEVYVVFQHLRDNQYNVHVDGSFCLESLAIETLCTMDNYTIAEVMRRTMDFMTMLPWDSFEKAVARHGGPSVQKNDIVASGLEYEVVSQTGDTDVKCTDVSVSDSEVDMDDFEKVCMVCMTSYIDGMVLKECQHWFCQQCWKRYIRESVLQGNGNIKCLEYKCNSRVDPMTVLAVCDYHIYGIYKKLWEARIVASDEYIKRCPREGCDRIMIINKKLGVDSNVPMHCGCGGRTCFSCQNASHWPASCRLAKAYVTRLRKDKLDSLVLLKQSQYVAKVKKCPYCHQEFEKNGGCNYMSCQCGNSFCWNCCKPFDAGFHQGGKCTFGPWQLKEINLTRVSGDSSSYEKAIMHRTAQCSSSVLHLRKKLKKYLPPNLSECPTKSVVTYYIQLHQVVEYIYVICLHNTAPKGKASLQSFKDTILFLISQLDRVFDMLGKQNAKISVNTLDQVIVHARESIQRFSVMSIKN